MSEPPRQAPPDDFTVRGLPRGSGPGAAYRFEIRRGEAVVARLWHDHRGDDHGVEFLDGTHEDAPLGGTSRSFLEGGGREPLRLTDKAAAWLAARLRDGPPSEPRRSAAESAALLAARLRKGG